MNAPSRVARSLLLGAVRRCQVTPACGIVRRWAGGRCAETAATPCHFFQTQKGRQLIWHNGLLFGSNTYNGRYPAFCVDVIVLSNLQGTDATNIGRTIGAEVPFTSGPTLGTS